ncbi:VaFE repeat-containing surface-anchored protein [Parvibacter caecicola]|uniref:VaFE repeat-containing surface-anchored protein n=1 Tax=Parvibacter caecicola TaxID=747645 RepID=UPI0023F4BD4D|nr:VaFE repeat-containing surface-anchored protein [Parvibacter caecicola]
MPNSASGGPFGLPLPDQVAFEARRRRMRRRQRVWLSALLALLMVLMAVPVGLSLAPRNALAASAVHLTVGDYIYYDGARTCYMEADGSVAYCMDPQLPTPAPGTYRTVEELAPANPANASTLRAAAWYSFGGPGFDAAMWPDKWFDGTPMNDGRYVVLGHLLVSQLFTSSEKHATAGCGQEFVAWAKQEVLGWDRGEVINPDATRFKVEAGRGKVPASFKAFQIPTGTGTQTLISFTYNPLGHIQLQKASNAPALTQGNGMYSLEGARYGVFSDNACRAKAGEMVTDRNGCAQLRDVVPGRYYVRELAAPPGYGLDETVYPVDVADGANASVNGAAVPETPQASPVEVLAQKHDLQFGRGEQSPQGDASLAGAQFTVRHFAGIYGSAQAAEGSGRPLATWVFSTDESGVARFAEECKVSGPDVYRDAGGTGVLALGTYLVQETQAPAGYEANDEVFVIQVAPGGTAAVLPETAAVAVAEPVVRGGISLQKVDAETEEGLALGRAQLEGTQFEIRNVSACDVVVAGQRFAPGQVVATIACDAHGRAATAEDLLPFGTYEVAETQPGLGYLFGGAQTKTVAVRQAGFTNLDVAGGPLLFENQTVRGNLSFVKAREADMGRLAGVPFLITSLTTGEAHVAVTDENGQFNSADNWNSHQFEPNGNDGALREDGTVDESLLDAARGIWFGAFGEGRLCAPNSRGALPFDRYSIEELPVAANQGLQLISIPSVSVTRDGVAVDLGTLDDSDAPGHPEPEIFTQARADNGTAVAPAAESVVLTDRVSYGRLQPGESYLLTAQLVDRKTGEFLYQDGEALASQLRFVPEAESGEVEISVPLNTAALEEGAEVVFYETLAKGEEDEVVALHQDLSNSFQTVAVAHPLLRTTLATADGQKTFEAQGLCTLVDTVEYEGLEPGRSYWLQGRLMRTVAAQGGAVTAQPLLDAAGNPVEAQVQLVPERSGGTALVEFSFDGELLQEDSQLVAFEQLLQGDALVAAHEDAEDANQTVSVTVERPQPPAEKASPLPKTGDDVLPFALAAAVAAGAAGLAVFARRGHRASEHFRKRL